MDVLTVSGLTTALIKDGRRSDVVSSVSLRVGAGESVALVGESGSGKTMTILSIARLLPHFCEITGGEVRFQGQNLLTASASELRKIRGGRLGFVFQDPSAFLNP